jgi:hypothetical protein
VPLYYSCAKCDRLFERKGREVRCPSCPSGWPTTSRMPSDWTRTRNRHLRAHPNCAWCGDRAVTVDHVLARALGAQSTPTTCSRSAVPVFA